MARAGLLDVPRHECRPARAGGAVRLDLEPQFRRPARLQGPHPPRLADDGGRGCDRRALRGYPRLALSLSPGCLSGPASSSEPVGAPGVAVAVMPAALVPA